MEFDVKKFMATKFKPRTEDIKVPDLAAWFPEEAPPVIKVRGLTGEEVARTNEAAAKNRNIAAIMDALASVNAPEMAEAIKEAIGVSGQVPDDLAKRIEQLIFGCIKPKFDLPAAVKFFQVFPVEGYIVSTAIMRLTGQGQQPGESKPSGKAKT